MRLSRRKLLRMAVASVPLFPRVVLAEDYPVRPVRVVLGLSPGGSDTLLKNGGEITYTQSAVVIERLIGKVIQSLGSSGSGESTKPSEPAPAPKDGAK